MPYRRQKRNVLVIGILPHIVLEVAEYNAPAAVLNKRVSDMFRCKHSPCLYFNQSSKSINIICVKFIFAIIKSIIHLIGWQKRGITKLSPGLTSAVLLASAKPPYQVSLFYQREPSPPVRFIHAAEILPF